MKQPHPFMCEALISTSHDIPVSLRCLPFFSWSLTLQEALAAHACILTLHCSLQMLRCKFASGNCYQAMICTNMLANAKHAPGEAEEVASSQHYIDVAPQIR